MQTKGYASIPTSTGPMPVFVPNSIMDGDGFYVSFNDHDTSLYGDVTTALVKGQMQHFYILNGDHRAAYQPLISQGFDACLDYFRQHQDAINKCSEV